MRRLYPMLLLAIVLAPTLPSAAAQTQAKGNKYAILVGCSKYLKTDFRELPYTGNDIKGFREALVQTGFRDEHVVILHDTTKDPHRYLPQKANILTELDLLLDGMREQDTLVVALSGHGLQFKGDPVSYFVPVDGRVEDKSTLIALSGKDGLYERLKNCKAKQKLLIVNACRNDPTVSPDFATKKVELADEDRNEVPEGIAAIYSCQAGQKSYYDKDDRKIALFFDHVIRAWKGEYNDAGELTLEKFFEQVTDKTKMDANKTLRAAQTPSVQREYAGKWVIAKAGLAKGKEKAKGKGNEPLVASEFAEFTQLWLGSWNKAESWLGQHAGARLAGWREAANAGSPEAMVMLGNCVAAGKGLPKDEKEAVQWFRKAAELGNDWGQHDLAVMYSGGRGVAKDDAEAVKWYRKSAEQGNPWAQRSLGLNYANGRGVAKDDAEAVKWYRKAADQGNSAGQYHLGVMYQNGRGVAKDEVEALKWHRKSAELGFALGQYELGMVYKDGRGVARDDVEAVKWVRKSAEQGHAAAQNELGVMYQNARGMPKDEVEAVKWFRKAVDHGHAMGQFNLGWMFEFGRGGVRLDLAEAVRLYRLASQGGNQSATDALRRLKQ